MVASKKQSPARLTIWKPRLSLPPELRQEVANFESLAAPFGPECGAIEPLTVKALRSPDCTCYYCDGLAEWHTDPFHDRYGLLWVLRNDLGSSVQVWHEPLLPQTVGTIMILNSHRRHRLGTAMPRHPYVVAVLESRTYPSRREVEARFANILFEAR